MRSGAHLSQFTQYRNSNNTVSVKISNTHNSALAKLDKAQKVNNINPVNFNNTNLQTVDLSKHGPIAQLINNQYQDRRSTGIKRLWLGRKLKIVLERDYSDDEFSRLPESIKNLLRFHKSISTAEIIKFIEFFDKSHEITFKDYNFDHVKFRALFEALGDLESVDMQVGPNNFVALSDSFDLKQKIWSIFSKFKNKVSFVEKAKPRRRRRRKKEESLDP